MPEGSLAGGGPESQGVNFVLSVQDFSTNILTNADKVYQHLLDTMKKVGQWGDKFSTDIIGKATRAQAIDKGNGGVSPIITPFSLNQKALDMMPKFIKNSYDWLRTSAAGMSAWATQIGIAGSRTRDFRDALAQAEIEGSKFKDQFAGVGSILGGLAGKAIGRTTAAVGSALAGAVAGGAFGYAEIYEKMHEVGMMMGWNTKKTEEATHRYLELANATNLSVEAFVDIAHALAAAHVPVNQSTEDLLKFAATAVEISKVKAGEGGAINEQAVVAVMSNLIKIQKFSNQQVAAFLTETSEKVLHSSLTWTDALNMFGDAEQGVFDMYMKNMDDAQRAGFMSKIIPQWQAFASAAKDANVPLDIFTKTMKGLNNPNTKEFQNVAALFGTTSHTLDSIVKSAQQGNFVDVMNAMHDSVSQLVRSLSPAQLTAFTQSFNSIFGEDALLRYQQMGVLPEMIDRTTKSLAELDQERQKELAEKQNTPLSQLELIYKNIKDFWRELGGQKNEEITKGLAKVNEYLKESFNFFKSHETISAIVFWSATTVAALSAVLGAWKILDMLGWGDVLIGLTSVFRGLAGAVIGLRDAELAAAIAGKSMIASLAVPIAVGTVGAALAAGAMYEAQQYKKENESKISHGQSGHYDLATNQVVADVHNSKDAGMSEIPEGMTWDSALGSGKTDTTTMEKHLLDIKDMLKKATDKIQLQPSRLSEKVSGWPNQSPSF